MRPKVTENILDSGELLKARVRRIYPAVRAKTSRIDPSIQGRRIFADVRFPLLLLAEDPGSGAGPGSSKDWTSENIARVVVQPPPGHHVFLPIFYSP